MEQFHVKEQILYSKRGTPKSVLLDYKTYKKMLEILEDAACIRVIESRKSEQTISENEMKRRLRKR